jgi:hypothetical protein
LSTIQTATEALIRLAKQAIHQDAVLVFADDLFEVQSTPSVIIQGPKLTEDRFRRGQAQLFDKNTADLIFEECRFPRLYHLDFDLVVTVDREPSKNPVFSGANKLTQNPGEPLLGVLQFWPLFTAFCGTGASLVDSPFPTVARGHRE